MIRQKRQRHLDVNEPKKGDCFATCVAMLLDLDQDEVPNFCSAPEDEWWEGLQAWLNRYHLTAVEVRVDKASLCWVTEGTPCILSGKSPRGDWLHSVVAFAAGKRGFEYAFDPHPADTFLDGEPQTILFFASLRPDRARMSHADRPCTAGAA